MVRLYWTILSIVLLFQTSGAQDKPDRMHTGLDMLFDSLVNIPGDQERLRFNERIMDSMEAALKLEGAFDYEFDSLQQVGSVYSFDQEVRILNWNVPLSKGHHKYACFIMHRKSRTDGVKIHRLLSRDTVPDRFLYRNITPDEWYGALYYSIVHTRYKGKDYYTLLGHDFNDRLTTKKYIDVLVIEPDGSLYFGLPIFKTPHGLQERMVFEYSAQVAMLLHWDRGIKMIVFDHLSPVEPALTGHPEFYGPDLSYDGLVFKKGYWEYMPDIDVRNSF